MMSKPVRIAISACVVMLAAGCEPGNLPGRPWVRAAYMPGIAVDSVEVNGKEVARDLRHDARIAASTGDQVCVYYSLGPDMRALAAGGLNPRVTARIVAEGYEGETGRGRRRQRTPATDRSAVGARPGPRSATHPGSFSCDPVRTGRDPWRSGWRGPEPTASGRGRRRIEARPPQGTPGQAEQSPCVCAGPTTARATGCD